MVEKPRRVQMVALAETCQIFSVRLLIRVRKNVGEKKSTNVGLDSVEYNKYFITWI